MESHCFPHSTTVGLTSHHTHNKTHTEHSFSHTIEYEDGIMIDLNQNGTIMILPNRDGDFCDS